MQAALITGVETVELVDFPDPEPRPDQVVVDIAYCGICGTDVHAWQSGQARPSVCGHEWVGTLSEVGAEVGRLSEGDRVVIAVPPSCGGCDACHAGQMDKCQTVLLATVGAGPYDTPHGGFAPRLAIHHGRAIAANPLGAAAIAVGVLAVAVSSFVFKEGGLFENYWAGTKETIDEIRNSMTNLGDEVGTVGKKLADTFRQSMPEITLAVSVCPALMRPGQRMMNGARTPPSY